MTGRRISHFEVLEKLGEGGMGVVYKARDLELGRTVALKMLPASLSADPGRRARFLQEAQAASALNHPGIVTVYEIFREDGNEFIAMEYLDGKTLADSIGPKGMKLEEALRVGEQIAAALGAAHGAGIVHRDLKPANVMVTGLGVAKVLDFGLAKLTETGPEDATLTEAGTVMGTIAYMSPEQAEGKAVDWRSDIFSFGSLLYEMVTGRKAFGAEGRLLTLSSVMEQEPAAMGEAVPRELKRLVARCMKKKAGERAQSMVDVKHALEELRTEIASGQMSGAVGAGPGKKASWWPVMAAVAGVAVLVAGGVWMIGGRKAEAVVYKPVPFTSYPGLEQDPALSPDGNSVAFAWNGPVENNFDIYVRRVGSGEPLRLTQSANRDTSPAWSPNGDFLAFHRDGTAETRGVYVIPALGGKERRVVETLDSRRPITWTPDGKSLVIGNTHWFSLVRVDTGESTRLPLQLERKSHFHVDNPAFSPDGRELAFVVSDAIEGDSIHVVSWPAEGSGRVVQVGRHSAFTSIAWSTNGKSIYVADSQGGIAKLFRVAASGGQVPELVPGIGEHIVSITVAGSRLVYGNSATDFDLYRREIGPDSKVGPETPFLKSTRSERVPEFSPDGKEIGFISDRSGESEIWVANADGTEPRQLSKSAPAALYSWAPDSSEILFAARPTAGRGAFRIRRQGGDARQVGPPGAGRARWMADGKSIYYAFAVAGDKYTLYKIDRDGTSAPVMIEGSELLGLSTSFALSPDGLDLWMPVEQNRVLERNFKGLLRKRLPDGEPEAVAAKAGIARYSVGPNGIYFVETGSRTVQHCRFSDGKVTEVATLPEEFRSQFTVSPDGRTLVYARAEKEISDLYVVEGLR